MKKGSLDPERGLRCLGYGKKKKRTDTSRKLHTRELPTDSET